MDALAFGIDFGTTNSIVSASTTLMEVAACDPSITRSPGASVVSFTAALKSAVKCKPPAAKKFPSTTANANKRRSSNRSNANLRNRLLFSQREYRKQELRPTICGAGTFIDPQEARGEAVKKNLPKKEEIWLGNPNENSNLLQPLLFSQRQASSNSRSRRGQPGAFAGLAG